MDTQCNMTEPEDEDNLYHFEEPTTSHNQSAKFGLPW